MKYTKELIEEYCNYIRQGMTQKQAAEKVDISESRLYVWLNDENKKEFKERIKKARADYVSTLPTTLANSLYRRAMGYDVEETEIDYIDKNGKPVIKNKKVRKKHVLPDTAAIIFALTNLDKEHWQNRQTQNVNASVDADVRNNNTYDLKDIPDDMLLEMADKLQDAQAEREKKIKENGEED